MSSLVLTLTETLRYRGAIGQWSWVLHRISGLGVVLFLTLHVVDTSWAVFYPELYEHAIATYQSPLFTIGEFGLVACVVYHAYNGVRIALIDYRPKWWKHQQRAAWIVLGLTVATLVPVFILMFGHVLEFYSDPESEFLPLAEVITAQLPFVAGIVVAAIAALLFSALAGLIAGSGRRDVRRGSNVERLWWGFMRVSGLLIVPLVFGHLAMMHVIQGVFDITAANHAVVGTNAINASGTAVEFVADRWSAMVAGVSIWRVYDFMLLVLVVVHGFNGLRYVLTDYTMKSPLLRRASIYFCTIGAVVLLAVGGGALLNTIPSSTARLAEDVTADMAAEEGAQTDNPAENTSAEPPASETQQAGG